MKSLNNKKSVIVLAIIIVLQVVLLISAGCGKKGFFVDELWSYGLSNSYYHPHIYSNEIFLQDQYLLPIYFKDYLEVDETDAFKYDSVFYNQENDNHPPLFYCVLHTVSSLFPNSFSKWFGIIPNIFYFIIANIALFFLSKKIFQNNLMALMPPLIWGFSIQTVSYAIMIRMYMLFAMFVILNSLVHCRHLKEDEKWTLKDFCLLFIINFLGFMTQYYYYIYAFFLSAFTTILMLKRRQWKQVVSYVSTMFLGLLIAFFSFPGVINTFKDNRGAEAIRNLTSENSYFSNLKNYINNMEEKMLYGVNGIFIVALGIGVIICIVYMIIKLKKQSLRSMLENINLPILALLFSSVFYFMVIVKIAPYIADRYYFGITPIFVLTAVYIIVMGWNKVLKRSYVACTLVGIIFFYSIFSGYKDNKIMYQYKNQEQNRMKLQEYKGSACLYITKGREYTVVENALELQNFSKTKVIDVNRKSIAESEIDDKLECMIVFIDDYLDQEEIIREIITKTRYKDANLLFRTSGIWWEDADELFVYEFE